MVNILKDIVLPFVAKYDQPFKYNEALRQLWEANAFDAPDDPAKSATSDLAHFVGASYCAMIREDVFHRLPEGMQLARRSRGAATELQCRAEKGNCDQDQLYALIRWTDALGRLYYRTGNYTLARVEFDKCKTLIGDPDNFYWCWSDIESNLQRTIFEICFQVNSHKEKSLACYPSLIEAGRYAEDKLLTERDPVKSGELKRSIVSCYHNSLRCRKYIPDADRTEGVVGVPETFDKLKTMVRDDIYRDAQLKNEIAQHAGQNPQAAAPAFRALLECPWPRGRFFARQNLARLAADASGLLDLCELIDSESNANGESDVVDLDRFAWTLTFAEDLQHKMDPDQKNRLNHFQERITRAISNVISVATYRYQFETKIRQRIRLLLSARTQTLSLVNRKGYLQEFDGLVDFIESFASREILEILRVNRAQKTRETMDANAARFLVEADVKPAFSTHTSKWSPSASPPQAGSPRLDYSPVTNLPTSAAEKLEAQADKARQVDERYWLDHPLKMHEPSGSPSQRARQITVADSDVLLLRYTQVAEADKSVRIGVFWWYQGRSEFVYLPQKAFDLMNECMKPINGNAERFYKDDNDNTRIPCRSMADDLWQNFIKPVLDSIDVPQGRREIRSITIVLEPGLYHLPLNFSWLPEDSRKWFASGVSDVPLALACDLCFSLNLSAHLLEGRRDYGVCRKLDEDNLFVLHHCPAGRFDGPGKLALIEEVIGKWGETATLARSAQRDDIVKCFNARAEYLMIACHGALSQSGSVLAFNKCYMVSSNLAYSVALHGNRVLVLGACDSATPRADSYGQFIGAFIAAGAGAVLANPCRSPIVTVCGVAAPVLERIRNSEKVLKPVNLATALRECANELANNYPWKEGGWGPTDHKLWASTYQLWL